MNAQLNNDYTATYSPEDNKLRLYSRFRLNAETYQRVKDAGFIWAPKQEFFVAPMWTPAREDLLLEMCGVIEDEDSTLMGRAEERSQRFDDYQNKRQSEAERASEYAHEVGARFADGQPILVGHHSERRARKDKERIEGAMRKAVQLWDTAEYWSHRATAAIRHAKYKERADVRTRRIKKLGAEQRKHERHRNEAQSVLNAYQDPKALQVKLSDGRAMVPALLGSYDGGLSFDAANKFKNKELSFDDALKRAIRNLSATIAHNNRWIAHYENRVTYETALLGEQRGTASDRKPLERGGAVRCWVRSGAWLYIEKVNKVTVSVLDNWGNGGANFRRNVPFDALNGIMTKAEVDAARSAGLLSDRADKTGFVLHGAPAAVEEPAPEPVREAAPVQSAPIAKDIEKMREQLRTGIKVVAAPQLFPTPAELAERMVDEADIEEGLRVLEPSAGTARIVAAVARSVPLDRLQLVTVEINHNLSAMLRASHPGAQHLCADFLEWNAANGEKFDRILMNPPFENGVDIKHITRALTLLKEGGVLVAICANGPRQQAALKPLAENSGGYWEDLPRETFKQAGTLVNTALLVIRG